jgi:hypothetical protein
MACEDCRCAGKRTTLDQGRVTITADSEGRVASIQVFTPDTPDPYEEGSIVLSPEEACIVDRWARYFYKSGKMGGQYGEFALWDRLPDAEAR